jgi:hypothetical protein
MLRRAFEYLAVTNKADTIADAYAGQKSPDRGAERGIGTV